MIQLFENISLAVNGLRASKMRALLTMLGIIIGIGSVITIMTIGDAMTNSLMKVFNDMGANSFQLMLDSKPDEYGNSDWSYEYTESDYLSDEMIEAYQEKFSKELFGLGASIGVGNGQVRNGRNQVSVQVSGVTPNILRIQNVKIVAGHDINERENKGAKNVAVISDEFVRRLFPGMEPHQAIGKEVRVRMAAGQQTFTISGVYKYEMSGMAAQMAGGGITTQMFIPVKTAQKITNADNGYYYVQVRANPEVTDLQAFIDKTTDFFNNTYYRSNKNVQTWAYSMDSQVQMMNTQLAMMKGVVSVIAAISLLVGGIGVMNIMLVSVTERTREIGTRKALGAKNAAIRIQFIVESMIICMIGGIFGVALGTTLGRLGSVVLGAPGWPSIPVVLIAVGFSMAIGVFFGYYPANKAAKLDPIEALRYE